MNDGVQFLDTVRECEASQFLAINRSVVLENLSPKRADYAFICSCSRGVKLMSQFVSRKIVRASLPQHLADGGLPASDAASKAYAQHSSPRAKIAVMWKAGMSLLETQQYSSRKGYRGRFGGPTRSSTGPFTG